MKSFFNNKGAMFLAALASFFIVGCDSGDSGGGGTSDIGDNDSGIVVCVGDSITHGEACGGAPYPTHMAQILGKQVRNGGVPGATSDAGISAASAGLELKPAYMCILYGSNDAAKGRDAASVAENIRAVINLCKANSTIPIVGTPPAQTLEHAIYNVKVKAVADAIKNVCKEEGVTCVDLYNAFGGDNPDDTLYVSDGLHPTLDGCILIAQKFAAKIK